MQAFLLEDEGFKELADRLSPQNRRRALQDAMHAGGVFVRKTVRDVYKAGKPNSTLYNAIVLNLFPTGEGAIVRRFYVKGGTGELLKSNSDLLRGYILNFVEKGAKNRKTRKGYNRGSIRAFRFFRRGVARSKNGAIELIRQSLLAALEKQANR